MALQIINAGPPAEETVEELRQCILEAIPGARVEISSGGPGHFEICVGAPAFAGKSRVGQQQLVYAAIAHLMSGKNPAVHAVDRLECTAE